MDDNKVAVLLEDLMSQFRTFGEGLQMLNEKMDRGFETLKNRMIRWKQELTYLKIIVRNTTNNTDGSGLR